MVRLKYLYYMGLGTVGGSLTAAVAALLWYRLHTKRNQGLAQSAKKLLAQAKQAAEQERREAQLKLKEELYQKRAQFEASSKEERAKFESLTEKHRKRKREIEELEDSSAKQRRNLQDKERELHRSLDKLHGDEARVKKLYNELVVRLEKISGVTKDEAKKVLADTIEHEVRHENARMLQELEKSAKDTAEAKGTDILITAMQRALPMQMHQHTTSTVQLPSEEIKGKIIGKEGRNIRSLEMATGMEFILTDGPEILTISGFNPVRRELARRTVIKLVEDGRINPSRIEEAAAQCEAEMDDEIMKHGKEAIMEFNLTGVHEEMVRLLGRLHFRTSYSQNVLAHCREVASFARMVAAELGLDSQIAARCGLFHDIGKAVSGEIEGPHAAVGATLAKQYGENPIVVNAIAAHHEEVPYESVYGALTTLTDAMSASRPGARRETRTSYIKRLEQLEDIAKTFEGVKKSYALQAGREIRVIVDETTMDDTSAAMLAKTLAYKIRSEMNFPGQIKVNVIRESRAVEYAR